MASLLSLGNKYMERIRRILEISRLLSDKVLTENIFRKKSDSNLIQKLTSFSRESDQYKAIVNDYGRPERVYKKLQHIKGFNDKKAWKEFQSRIDNDKRVRRVAFAGAFRYSAYVAVAASVLLCIVLYRGDIGTTWIVKGGQSESLIVPDPGKSMVLTSGGDILFIDSSSNAVDISSIIKASRISHIEEFDFALLNKKNTIMVPYGAICNFRLDDGTVVQLNSGSVLEFPSDLSGDTREVTLSGEAYFDVAYNPEKPFIVKTARFSVRVLGTSFNISCYNDEKSSKVSLARGSVRVLGLSGEVYATLLPDQQMCLNEDGTVDILPVNTPMITSWKDGVFIFDNESIEAIAKKLEKFYNINIVIKDDNVRNLHYYAYFKRYQNPTDVFDILRMTKEIDYSVENNVLTIFSYNK